VLFKEVQYGQAHPEQILNRAHELWEQNGKPDGAKMSSIFRPSKSCRELTSEAIPEREVLTISSNRHGR
jgi:hypothetical protein